MADDGVKGEGGVELEVPVTGGGGDIHNRWGQI